MNNEMNSIHPYHNHQMTSENFSVTPLMIQHLRATKPWVRFISVMMFIMGGLVILAGFFMMFMPSMPGMRGAGFGFGIGIVYFLLGFLYIVPGYLLGQYASAINKLLLGGGDVAMEDALGSQKSFWRFVGILTLVLMCIYALIFFFVIAGSLTALSRF